MSYKLPLAEGVSLYVGDHETLREDIGTVICPFHAPAYNEPDTSRPTEPT